MRKATEWLKKGTALVMSCALAFSTNFVYSNIQADETLPEGAKKAVHLTAPIEDGVYRVTINMMNANSKGQYSMGNAALRGSATYNTNNPADTDYKQLVVVKDGKATAVVQFMPMGFIGTYGFMMELEGVNPNAFTKYGMPLESHTEYTTTQTITEHRTQDGNVVYDTYNDPDSENKFDGSDATAHKRPAGYGKEEQLINIVDKAYPSLITVDVTPVAQEETDLPTGIDEYDVKTAAFCHIFVPVMFSISASSGDQYARLLVDWQNAEKVAEPEKDLDYQLYRALNVNSDNASKEKYETFAECKNNIVEKLENAWPSQHLTMDGAGFNAKPIIDIEELTDEEKITEALKLNDAINAFEADDTEETTPQETSSIEQTTSNLAEETTKTQVTTTQTASTTTATQQTTKVQETTTAKETTVKETVAKVSLKTVKKIKKKKITVKWSKLDKVNGYQIRYSTNKNLKKAKTITTKKNVSTISFKTNKNKKYYVQIRAYIKTKDGIIYGKWSKVKATKLSK